MVAPKGEVFINVILGSVWPPELESALATEPLLQWLARLPLRKWALLLFIQGWQWVALFTPEPVGKMAIVKCAPS